MTNLIKCKFCEIWDSCYSIIGHYKRKHPEKEIKTDWLILKKENMPNVDSSLIVKNFIAKEEFKKSKPKKVKYLSADQAKLLCYSEFAKTKNKTNSKPKNKHITNKKSPDSSKIKQNKVCQPNKNISHNKLFLPKSKEFLQPQTLINSTIISQNKNDAKIFKTCLKNSSPISNDVTPMPHQDLSLGNLALLEGTIEKNINQMGVSFILKLRHVDVGVITQIVAIAMEPDFIVEKFLIETKKKIF